jgi:hypothetical protein
MFCDRLLAAGGVVVLLTGCGAKGPPKPPLSREPQAVRDFNVRQAGGAIELRWSRPRARANGDPIQGPLTFRVLARNLERTPVSGSAAVGVAGAPAAPGTAGTAAGSVPGGTAGAATTAPAPSSPSGSGGANVSADARASEESFLRDSEVVSEIAETPDQVAAAEGSGTAKGAMGAKGDAKTSSRAKEPDAGDQPKKSPAGAGGTEERATGAAAGGAGASAIRPPETQYSILLGPEHFPAARFTSVRLAFAVVAVDSSGRRSRARPIIEIDPVETLPPPSDLRASGRLEGVELAWRLPEPPTPLQAAEEPTPAPAEMRGVDVYRTEVAPSAAAPASGTAPAAAAPRFPYKPIAGSPFTGQSGVDRTAVIGASYLYEARTASLAPGKGLRESVSSGTAALVFADLFPPGSPTLVTAIPGESEGAPHVQGAWSSPIDADVAGYRVYRAEGDGPFVLAASTPAGQIEWTDKDVKRGARYRYTVVTIDAAVPPNESARSEEAEAAPPAEAP